MAEFTRETAKIEEVYQRRLLPNGDSKYIRKPVDIVTYDDGGTYLQPANLALVPFTAAEQNAGSGVTQIIADAEVFPDTFLFR